ncbi:DUF7332 family protein [Salinigranum marinum]|uniref:DUF7332 family protein n=1 Tax=Salinigranum marinum TaxID=1515595 RepID=UPI002989CA55|nr:hypothetical protein [Salinigranum marinum]
MSRPGPVTAPSLVVSALVLALVVAAPPVSAVTTAAATTGPEAEENRCFSPNGTGFVIGTESPQLRLVVHLSLLSAVVDGEEANATRFVADPFEPFAFAFDYRFTVPAFEGTAADADYRAADAPVEGPVEEAACST